jgi:hypothetical protein
MPPTAACANHPAEAHAKTPNHDVVPSDCLLLVERVNCAGGEQ